MDKDKLVERQQKLIRTVEAIDALIRSREWMVIKEDFDALTAYLEGQMLSEAKRPKIEVEKIYFIQGQLATAKRYDLINYMETLKRELQGIKKQLQ